MFTDVFTPRYFFEDVFTYTISVVVLLVGVSLLISLTKSRKNSVIKLLTRGYRKIQIKWPKIIYSLSVSHTSFKTLLNN